MAKIADSLAAQLRVHARTARLAAGLSLGGPLVWLAQAALLSHAIDGVLRGDLAIGGADLAPYAAGFLALAGLRIGFDSAALGQTQRLSANLRAGLRAALIGHALRLAPNAQNDDFGGMASLMGEGISQIGPWVERYRPAMWRAKVLPLIILALVAAQSWAAALALILTGPLIPVFMALVGWAAEAASRAHLVEQGALNRVLIDRVAALVDLRLLGAAGRAGEDLAHAADKLRAGTMAVLRLAFLSSAVLEFFAALGVAMVALYVGLSLLDLIDWGATGAALSPFGGIFILLIVPDFYQPLRDLAAAWHDRAAAEAAGAAIDEKLAQTDVILGQGGAGAGLDLPQDAALWWQDLTITRGVALGSGGRKIALPAGHVPRGEALALVGPSGVGKTTALLALAGLTAAQGRWGIGAQDMKAAHADSLRAQISYIPQVPRFAQQSLGEWLGGQHQPDTGRVWGALQLAQIADVVRALPQSLGTVLGETGGGISGGEARRLMIARALIAGRAFVLADEPTADLDSATAREVIEALMALRLAGIGLVLATHDAALIARCDRVIDLGRAQMQVPE